MTLVASERERALSGGEVPDGLTVVIGDERAPEGAGPVVRFAERAAPRPAADALFALAPNDPRCVLVVGDFPALAAKLRERGLEVRREPALTVAAIETCGAVFLDDVEEAFCALAAARLVVIATPEVTFGLQDGIDCFFAANDDEAAAVFDAAARAPQAFAPIAATGRLAAEHHRASEVYRRLAIDLLGEARYERNASST